MPTYFNGKMVSGGGGGSGGGLTLKTRLTIIGTIAAGSTFSCIASGPNYTHSGDITSMELSQVLFRLNIDIRIQVNGVEQDKETEILWVSSTTFQLIALPVDAGDILTIYN